MQWIEHAATAASCVSAEGSLRSIASKMAFGKRAANAALAARAREVMLEDAGVGRVHALGAWREPALKNELDQALGPLLAPALRADFEWYQCRGAFFHNDAHYDARLFGIWCVIGPPAELVFPRAKVRLPAAPGSIAVFDPFEVHGVLAPERSVYLAQDYEDAAASVFVGFELDITAAVTEAFGIALDTNGRVISSRTRIAADSGAIELD